LTCDKEEIIFTINSELAPLINTAAFGI